MPLFKPLPADPRVTVFSFNVRSHNLELAAETGYHGYLRPALNQQAEQK